MDILNKLALDLFESKESYTTNDYLTIMNILMVQYHRLNGNLPSIDNDKDLASEAEDSDDETEDNTTYSDYYGEGYLDDYIEPY